MPPISATSTHWPPVRLGDCGDVAVNGDGEPDELGDPALDCVGLGDVELRVELADVELGVCEPEVAADVTLKRSMAMGALPPAPG